MSLIRVAVALLTITPALLDRDAPIVTSLTVHEWGTFTSVAALDGSPLAWAPLSGSPDLPCFVNRLSTFNLKLAPGLVRMETPVLYFYSPRPMTASVHVDFPQGWITEWYPQATRVEPELPSSREVHLPPSPFGNGSMDWDPVQISPGIQPDLPAESDRSRYFAARNTDSSPLQIGGEQEKFIFYRGVGNFPVPLQPKFLTNETLQIQNTGSEPVPVVILFEKQAEKLGFRVVRNLQDTQELSTPSLTGSLEDLQHQLANALIQYGLFEKEAAAMLETWGDSWFDEGTRLFYIVPRAAVDAILPLRITPAPAITARAFVGRIEILSPTVRERLQTALATGDIETLAHFGRFLNIFLWQLENEGTVTQSPETQQYLERAYEKMAQDYVSPACIP